MKYKLIKVIKADGVTTELHDHLGCIARMKSTVNRCAGWDSEGYDSFMGKMKELLPKEEFERMKVEMSMNYHWHTHKAMQALEGGDWPQPMTVDDVHTPVGAQHEEKPT